MTKPINFIANCLSYAGDVAFDYPVFLDLTAMPTLVVGAGPVAARKAAGLLAAGAHVVLVAPEVGDEVGALAADPGVAARVTVRIGRYHPSDLDGVHLVITATNDPAANAAVATDARTRGVLVNSADDPANCTFILPAIARRGRITAAVSSGGASPALAQHVRDRIAAEVLTEQIADASDVLAEERAAIHERGETTEGLDWPGRLRDLLAEAPARPHNRPAARPLDTTQHTGGQTGHGASDSPS